MSALRTAAVAGPNRPALRCSLRAACPSFGGSLAPLSHPAAAPCVVPASKRVERPTSRGQALPRAPEQPPAAEGPVWLQGVLKGAALCALGAALVLGAVGPAEAARSGGRMGGSAFSSRSFSSGRSPSSLLGGSRSSPSIGLGGATVLPSFFLSPFGFGYGYGMPMGGGFLSLLFWGAFAVILIRAAQGVLGGGTAGELEDGGYGGGDVSVAKLQVGLLGSARRLQDDLERIAARADTSSPAGLHYVLQETVLSLLRNPEYSLYGFARSAGYRSAEDAEQKFNELSLEERGKFQKETKVNVGGARREASVGSRPGRGESLEELIVVTILVAAEGPLRLPKVTSRAELSAALSKLGAVRKDDVLAVEVLWTPEEEGDFFTRDDLAYDYPRLNTL